jgi:hypothetical protein
LREHVGILRASLYHEESEKSTVQNKLIQSSKGFYITDFLSEAIEKAIKQQRDSKLEKNLYNYLSNIWKNFKDEEGWKVAS